jgi:hypothetical protein
MHREVGWAAFFSIILILVFESMVFAEGAEYTTAQIHKLSDYNSYQFEKVPATWDTVIEDAWGHMTPLSENLKNNPSTNNPYRVKENVLAHSTDLELENILSCPDTDAVYGFESVQNTEDLEPGIVVGLKYTFKRFNFHRFHKSIRAFFSHPKRPVPDRPPSVALYFEIP